jgi:hypothetical protein
MSKFWSIAGLCVIGIIIADLITHPSGTSTAFKGVTQLEQGVGNQLLGSPSSTK